MESLRWPPVGTVVETESNPYLHMSELEPEVFEYRLSVPEMIADRPIPRLLPTTNESLRRADEAITGLAGEIARSGLDISVLLAGVLVRLEAISSSQIEDLDADLEAELVYDHVDVDDGEAGTEAALVRQNIGIVADAIGAGVRLDTAWLCDLHRRLMRGSDLETRYIGTFRDCPVWIGRTRATADFEGPPASRVDGLVDDLMVFANRADVHPVIQAAIAHAQFETIHPFVDGNGRLGRVLVHPILRRLAHGIVVPASHALLARRDAYFKGLSRYRSGDLDSWIVEFADAVALGAQAATSVTAGLDGLSRSWRQSIRSHRNGTVRAILENLPANPVVTIESARALRKVSQPTALAAVNKLVDARVLRPTTVRTPGRAHVWVAGGVLDVMASLERSIGRRQS